MTRSTLFVVAALALAACSDSKPVEPPEASESGSPASDSNVSVSVDTAGDETRSAVSASAGGGSTGDVEINLPGGGGMRVKLPDGIGKDFGKGSFEIEGVGLYPGATVQSLRVDAKDSNKASVQIGISAPADAAAVADWYQQQFEAKKVKLTRRGERLSGTMDDGDAFTIALEGDGVGKAKGVVTITEASKG